MIAIIVVLLSWFCFRMLFGGSRTHWTDEQDAPPPPENSHIVPRKGWW